MCAFFGFLCVHTCIFHGYMNFVAELLRFADREFYQACLTFCIKIMAVINWLGLVDKHNFLFLLSKVEYNSARLDTLLFIYRYEKCKMVIVLQM